MEKNTANNIVKLYALLAWVGATLNIIAGLALLLGGSTIANLTTAQYPQFNALVGGAGVFFGVLILAFGLVEAYVGYGLWTLQNWSRIAVIAVSVINLLNFPIGTVIGLIGIYLFGFNEDIRSLFHTSNIVSARASPFAGRRMR